MGITPGLFALAATLVVSLLHPIEALDEYVEETTTKAFEIGITIPLIEDYNDMATRHPAYFGRYVPHTHIRPASRSQVAWSGSVEQWRPLVAAYFRPGDVDRAMRIMSCESGGNPNAKNPGSSASGLFQHLGKYWTGRSAAAGFLGASIFNPTANVATAAWLRDQKGGWGHWVCR